MTKALLKKQLMEVFSWVYFDRKNGKNRSKGGIIGYAALYLFLFGFLIDCDEFQFCLKPEAVCIHVGKEYFLVCGRFNILDVEFTYDVC